MKTVKSAAKQNMVNNAAGIKAPKLLNLRNTGE